MDAALNFAKATLSAGITAGATTALLSTGHGVRLPAVPFNAVIWQATDYADPADAYWDGQAEIVRVTGRATDTLTITRAQESTAAVALNTGGKTYKLIAGLTAKVVNQDLQPKKVTNPSDGLEYTIGVAGTGPDAATIATLA